MVTKRLSDIRVATDVGGTFTDLVYCEFDEITGEVGEVATQKSDTTPPRFEEGILNVVAKAKIDLSAVTFFVHGSTVVINALTERKGARTALITTQGFRDVLEIARGNRPDVFNFHFQKPVPFVARHLRREVVERTDYTGRILTQPDFAGLPDILKDFRAEGIEAIAVCFLHSYANPENERSVKAEIAKLWPEVSVVASHEICREWREYERTSTTVLASYVHPVANRYLDRLETKLTEDGLKGRMFVMQSNGGIASIRGARANPIALVESGPASGMLGALSLGKVIGERNMIALDIGGTTAKCALIENSHVQLTTDYKIEWTRSHPGYPIKTPVVDLVEIGNGGGSIAWVDEGGRMHVGPKSAGAMPGPACYGRGGVQPTTTDANLVLGRIDSDNILGGEIVPDMDNVRSAFGKLATAMNVSVDEVARGIIRIANANMVNALKLVSLNRGYDPREFSLIAFGGGGAMHAASLANELQIPKVIIPVNPSVFSAWGMLMTDLRRDYVRTRLLQLRADMMREIGAMFAELALEATRDFAEDGIGKDRVVFEHFAELRYVGQEHGVRVRIPSRLDHADALGEVAQLFHEGHEREYTFRMDHSIELINFHLVAYGLIGKSGLTRRVKAGRCLTDALRKHRCVDFDDMGLHETPIYSRALLEPGMAISGPAIIEEPATTILVPPVNRAEVDDFGNILIYQK